MDNLDPLLPMLERGNFVTDPNVLAATGKDGVFVFTGETRQEDLRGQSVPALTSDVRGGALTFVDGHSMCQHGSESLWSTIATHYSALAC